MSASHGVIQKGQNQYIEIVHFINPNHFYYRLDVDGKYYDFFSFNIRVYMVTEQNDAIIFIWTKCSHLSLFIDTNEQLVNLEQRIEKYVKSTKGDNNLPFPGRCGDYAAVFMPQWQKWVRGQVEYDVQNGRHALLWLIDYGLPVRSRTKRMRPLAHELASDPLCIIYCGGVMNTLPGDTRYNVQKDENERVALPEWSPHAIAEMNKVILHSEVISFCPMLENCGRIFGKITFHVKPKSELDASHFLKELDKSFDTTTDDFLSALQKTDAIKARYRDNSGVIVVSLPYTSFQQIDNDAEFLLNDEFQKLRMRTNVDESESSSDVDIDAYNQYFDESASQIRNPLYVRQQTVKQAEGAVTNGAGTKSNQHHITTNQQNGGPRMAQSSSSSTESSSQPTAESESVQSEQKADANDDLQQSRDSDKLRQWLQARTNKGLRPLQQQQKPKVLKSVNDRLRQI